MAASIRNTRDDCLKERKPELVDKIDGFESDILMAQLLPNEDGFISIMDDRSVRIMLKRETGKFWPSVCYYTETNPTSLFYHPQPRRLFIGLDSGNLLEFAVGEDYNKITLIKTYYAHTARITSVYYSLEHDWVLSTSRDKHFAFHSTDNGKRVGSYNVDCFTTCLAYDTGSKHCFIGDNNGKITFLKLSDRGCEFKATLSGHESNITSLSWDPEHKFLYSGSYDKIIICWDIGGQKGVTYDLEGHDDRITSIQYVPMCNQLISGSEDSRIVIWDMDAKRKENPQWKESDTCEYCTKPFFWNIKAMWEFKTVGVRQHHCRRCGAAVCGDCSKNRSKIPVLGHEFQVRICNECIKSIVAEEKTSLAMFHEAKHKITFMSYDEVRKYLLTVGVDRVVKIWDMSAILVV